MRAFLKLSVCGALLLTVGCNGRVVHSHYYALETAPTLPGAVSHRQIAATIAVNQFTAPSYIRQGRIVFRQSPEEIGFYEYRRWAVDPAETITTSMIASLSSHGQFSIVKRYDGRNAQDYLMTGRLERLEELDYNGPVRVRVQISAELVNLRTGSTEWVDNASVIFNVQRSTVDSVVAQMNHAVEDCVDQLVASMDQRLAAKYN